MSKFKDFLHMDQYHISSLHTEEEDMKIFSFHIPFLMYPPYQQTAAGISRSSQNCLCPHRCESGSQNPDISLPEPLPVRTAVRPLLEKRTRFDQWYRNWDIAILTTCGCSRELFDVIRTTIWFFSGIGNFTKPWQICKKHKHLQTLFKTIWLLSFLRAED